MVASKVPLPNYRPDLDDKRPQREVMLLENFQKHENYFPCRTGLRILFCRIESTMHPFVQAVIPLGLKRRIEGLLQEHLDCKQLSYGKVNENFGDAQSIDQVEGVHLEEDADSFLDGSVMEKVLQRRSLRMRNMQRSWQV